MMEFQWAGDIRCCCLGVCCGVVFAALILRTLYEQLLWPSRVVVPGRRGIGLRERTKAAGMGFVPNSRCCELPFSLRPKKSFPQLFLWMCMRRCQLPWWKPITATMHQHLALKHLSLIQKCRPCWSGCANVPPNRNQCMFHQRLFVP